MLECCRQAIRGLDFRYRPKADHCTAANFSVANDPKRTFISTERAIDHTGDILEGLATPLHPGAIEYFQEGGISVP
jgi:TRAP-type uncharacterized transport system substrate-binding protein